MTMWNSPSLTNRPVVIFGGSALGRRIACVWISGGFNVHVQEPDVYERARTVQYVISNVGSYMKKIGSTQQGVITASEELDSPNAFNPWLVIETVPELLTDEATAKYKTDLLGDLDTELPDDCILCVNVSKHEGIFQKVRKAHRLLILHHYLIPNLRVIEMVKTPYTDHAVIEFLFKVIPGTGALPIVANEEASAGAFQRVWIAMKKEVCGSGTSSDFGPQDIDDGWDHCLKISSLDEMDDWFEVLSRETGDFLESSYTKGEQIEKSLLLHLKDVFIEEGNTAPFDGRRIAPLKLMRPGPNIFFIDVGHLESSTAICGRILCGSTDGTIREVVTNLRLPFSLSIHLASKRVYWSDIVDGTISSCNFNGTKPRIIVPQNSDAPKMIAVDQVNAEIYWTQSDGTQILRCDTEGNNIECVLETSALRESMKYMASPGGIALDPSRRRFYWSRPSSKDPKKYQIQCASMDLSPNSSPSCRDDIETLFDNLPEVHDLDFVPVYDEIYWTVKSGTTMQIHRGYVGPCPDYGMSKHNVVIGNLKGLGWVKVDPKAGHFYTTCARGTLSRHDMTTGMGELKMFSNEHGAFAGMALMYETLDWKQESPDKAASDESGNEGKGGYKVAKGKIIGMDGADELNSESTGTLSTVSSGEADMNASEEVASDDPEEVATDTDNS